MKIIFKISLLILVSTALRTMPKYDVDLDDMSTYTKVIEGKRAIIKDYIEKKKKAGSWGLYVLNAFRQNNTEMNLVEKYGKLANTVLHTSKFLDIPFEDLAFGFLELEGACFAGIAEDPSGDLWLLRNFDWNYDNIHKQLYADIDFYENGQLRFSGIQKIGFGILMNATIKGEYSMAINSRFKINEDYVKMMYRSGAFAMPWILNVVVQKAHNFKEAIKFIETEKWSSVAFIAIAGKEKNEKAIIQLEEKGIQIKTTNGRLISIGNNDVIEDDYKGESIKNTLDNFSFFTHRNLIQLIQQRPIKTSINIYTSVTKVATGETYAQFAENN